MKSFSNKPFYKRMGLTITEKLPDNRENVNAREVSENKASSYFNHKKDDDQLNLVENSNNSTKQNQSGIDKEKNVLFTSDNDISSEENVLKVGGGISEAQKNERIEKTDSSDDVAIKNFDVNAVLYAQRHTGIRGFFAKIYRWLRNGETIDQRKNRIATDSIEICLKIKEVIRSKERIKKVIKSELNEGSSSKGFILTPFETSKTCKAEIVINICQSTENGEYKYNVYLVKKINGTSVNVFNDEKSVFLFDLNTNSESPREVEIIKECEDVIKIQMEKSETFKAADVTVQDLIQELDNDNLLADVQDKFKQYANENKNNYDKFINDHEQDLKIFNKYFSNEDEINQIAFYMAEKHITILNLNIS